MSAPPLRPPALPGVDDGELFRSIFQASPDALLLVDPAGRILLANAAALELLGYDEAGLIGLPVEALVPDAVRPRHAAFRQTYAQAPRVRPMGVATDLVARRRDGSEVMVEIALSPLHSQGLPHVVAAIRGVGDYPRVRQALQRARYAEHLAQFGRMAVDASEAATLLAQMPAIAVAALEIDALLVLSTDAPGQPLRLAASLGLPPDTDGLRLDDIGVQVWAELEAEAMTLILPRAAGPGAARELPSVWRQAGWLAALVAPVRERGQVLAWLVAGSRTAHRFGDDEAHFLDSLASLLVTVLQRERSAAALSHSQRLESVGQLTGGIAHDFNNLLTIISGNLQVLEDTPACREDAVVQQLVAAASRAARSGADLTGKLLAFSRRQMLQPEPVDARALLESLGGMLRRTLDNRIAIDLQLEAAWCTADPYQLESALLNLAINARDAMPSGGRLTLACRPLAALQDDFPDAAPERRELPHVALSVADTGEGMSPATRARAFEPFFTTKAAGRGTGLGLSTVYGFAQQSRGALKLESAPGQGTRLTLYLPTASAPTAAAAADEERLPAPPRTAQRAARVLVVEDDPAVRQVVQSFLQSMACECQLCADGEEALAALEAGPQHDLLLTDIMLGTGLRGTELAEAARRRQPGLAALLMSGFSEQLSTAPAGFDLLRKPFTRAEFEAAVSKALAAGSSHPSSL